MHEFLERPFTDVGIDVDLKLEKAIAVVIGGAQGIGFGIANSFAREGGTVVLVDLNEKVEDSALQLADQFPGRVTSVCADATDDARMRQLAEHIGEEFHGDKHVVYAAGIGSGKVGFPFWNLEPEDWHRVVQVNLMGAVNVAHAFVRSLSEDRRGTILFISSVAGQIGSQTDPPYSAAKAGLINFAQCAAQDFAKYNVRVNVICPGMVQTEINHSVWKAWNDSQPDEKKQSYEDWAAEKINRIAPLARWQTVEEIGDLAVFLASDRARNMTGQTLNVDGGQVMHS